MQIINKMTTEIEMIFLKIEAAVNIQVLIVIIKEEVDTLIGKRILEKGGVIFQIFIIVIIIIIIEDRIMIIMVIEKIIILEDVEIIEDIIDIIIEEIIQIEIIQIGDMIIIITLILKTENTKEKVIIIEKTKTKENN